MKPTNIDNMTNALVSNDEILQTLSSLAPAAKPSQQ